MDALLDWLVPRSPAGLTILLEWNRDHERGKGLQPSPDRRLLACLGIGFCCFEAGCSSFGGLHSVGTWPPFAHLWERGPGSPSPENDTYAQAMRPTLGLDTKLADARKRKACACGRRRRHGAAERDSGEAIAARG